MTERTQDQHGGCRRGFYGALGLWLVTSLIVLFGGHGCTPRDVSARLQKQAEAALAAGGHTSISVEMDGQRAVLTGLAPSDDAKRAAEAAVAKAAGQGGAWSGGVTSVSSEVIVGAPVSPYSWNARRLGDLVEMSGYLPTNAVRSRVRQEAEKLFTQPAQDQVKVIAGAPDGQFDDVVIAALRQIRNLRRGEVRIRDTRVTIIGDGSAAQADAIRAELLKTIKAPYTVEVDVTDASQGLGIPELKGIDLSNAQAGDCQSAFATMMKSNVINFDSGSATISPSSRELLVNLARLARRCDNYTMQVIGHTDNVGDYELNMNLSRDRAGAVVKTLTAEGVAAERITADGQGSNFPIADNKTERGRAQNRRIEFVVQ